MNASQNSQTGTELIVRWIARIGSLSSIAMLLAFVIGERGDPWALTAWEWGQMTLFPFGVILGLAIAWWQEGVGGLIAIGSLVAFYLLHAVAASEFPRGPYFAIFTSPGLLFLISWWLDRQRQPHLTSNGTTLNGAQE